MVNEAGQKFEDNVIPQAIPLIQAREDATIPLLGAVNIMGMIPPSTKPDVDDAVFGVATWDKWDPKSDRFSIYVRGLSDGYKEIPAAERRQADRQVQDAADRLHPPRRRPQPERKGNPARRSSLRVGLLVSQCPDVSAGERNRIGSVEPEPVECRPADPARIAPAARQARRGSGRSNCASGRNPRRAARPRSMICSLLRVKSGA